MDWIKYALCVVPGTDTVEMKMYATRKRLRIHVLHMCLLVHTPLTEFSAEHVVGSKHQRKIGAM